MGYLCYDIVSHGTFCRPKHRDRSSLDDVFVVESIWLYGTRSDGYRYIYPTHSSMNELTKTYEYVLLFFCKLIVSYIHSHSYPTITPFLLSESFLTQHSLTHPFFILHLLKPTFPYPTSLLCYYHTGIVTGGLVCWIPFLLHLVVLKDVDLNLWIMV